MTIEEKAKQYANANNSNPNIKGNDPESHYTAGLQKGFKDGWKAHQLHLEFEAFVRAGYSQDQVRKILKIK